MFAEAYKTDGDKPYFGKNWVGPKTVQQGEPTLVAVYKPTNGDGKRVEVYMTALPARFFTLNVGGYELATGSGQETLVVQLAQAFANGMLSVEEA